MSIVNTSTGEITGPTYGEVRDSIDKAKASLEAAAEQIVWQIENQAWIVLGHADWNAMREAEYGGAAFMVPRAERPELVARMRASGLTHAEIAATAGVAEATVRNDLNRNSADEAKAPATITNSRGQERPTRYTPPAPKPVDQADLVNRAVAEFPDLTYYVNVGRERDVVLMADDLRRFRERGELDMRLDNIRRSIAVDRAKRDGSYRPGTTAVMGENGEYRMEPLPAPAVITRTCPTCAGTGSIKEQS